MVGRVRVGLSYVLDWLIVVCLAAAGGVLTYIDGFHRPFSLTDTSYAYPQKQDIVSLPVVAFVSLVGPAAVIFLLNLVTALLSRSSSYASGSEGRFRWSAVIWQTHASLLGLCVGLAATLFITAGLKDLVGKPRPDMLARCKPDLTNINKYVVGGFGMNLDTEAPPFVISTICTQTDRRLLDDGFASFPSGHSSFSSAGMVYLTLWLCASWNIGIRSIRSPVGTVNTEEVKTGQNDNTHAAPPLWQISLALTPIGVALFICASRYADFHHAGIDIIAGALLGTAFAWLSFRTYHRRSSKFGKVMASRPRDAGNAFFNKRSNTHDVEQARHSIGTELNYLNNTGPTRTGTTDSTRPILPPRATITPQQDIIEPQQGGTQARLY